MSVPGTPTAAQRARTVQIVWAALTASTGFYAAVAWILRGTQSSTPRPSLPSALLGAAPLVALVLGGVCLVVAWWLSGILGPTASLSAGDDGDSAATDQRRWGKIMSGTVTMGAFAETPAIVGLLLFLGGLPFDRFLLFVVVSLMIHGVVFFRMQAWIAAAQRESPEGT